MSKLYKNSKTINNTMSEKFFITTCPINDIKIDELLSYNDKRIILKTLYEENTKLQNNKEYVIKLGINNTIEKEYNIGKYLSEIPGFIKYICIHKCQDKLERYNKTLTKICPKNVNSTFYNVYILVMPYIKTNSIINFNWKTEEKNELDENKINLFKSVILQIILSIYSAFEYKKFIHNDLHLDNVLMRKTNKKIINYNIDGKDINILSYGFQICIMDFEMSFINVETTNKENQRFFYLDIEHMFADIFTHNSLSFEFNNENLIRDLFKNSILNYKNTNPKKFCTELFNIITNISKISIKKPKNIVYDPNILN